MAETLREELDTVEKTTALLDEVCNFALDGEKHHKALMQMAIEQGDEASIVTMHKLQTQTREATHKAISHLMHYRQRLWDLEAARERD